MMKQLPMWRWTRWWTVLGILQRINAPLRGRNAPAEAVQPANMTKQLVPFQRQTLRECLDTERQAASVQQRWLHRRRAAPRKDPRSHRIDSPKPSL